MTAAVLPHDAIDTERADHEWRRAFEWHLDQVPPLMEALGVLRMPSIRSTQFDKVRISGGGYTDYDPQLALTVTDTGAIVDAGYTRDQAELWAMLVEYVRAVTAWLNATITVPHAPILPPLAQTQWQSPRPSGDPLTARAEALHAIGWLIDHAPSIQVVALELEPFREDLFTLIRRTRGRHRSAGTRRRARPRRCGICGECAVIVDWVDGANGSPRPVQVGKCKICGQTYTEQPAAAAAAAEEAPA